MARHSNVVVGLDIGTTKIAAIVGEVREHGIDIIGIGTHPSRGLKKGAVINVEATVGAIKKAVEEAELMAGVEIQSVNTGIAGGHIKGVNSHGTVAVKDKEIRETDVRRVIDAAKAIAIPMDREVIHVLPQEFVVDGQDGIKDPIGMCGVRLEAKVHIVTGAVANAQNIIRCAQRCGLSVSDIVLQPLASAEAVLTDEEKELGVALIDIGGGTTDIAVYHAGAIVHTSVLTLGGNHLTNDIAVGLRTPANDAERIKQRYGCAVASMVEKGETIEVPSVGNRPARILPRQILTEIIEPRVDEIFELAKRDIEAVCRDIPLGAGVVITGGSTLLEGMAELAEDVMALPVRRGVPRGIGGLVDVVKSPMYATGVGLVQHGMKNMDSRHFRVREDNVYDKVIGRMQQWFRDVF
ncbi:MAG: cell division protein FtsA [Deltaproteobacteria bacterium]|nr:cell division protein FtsA [Deltaproteobacteria bacterium]